MLDEKAPGVVVIEESPDNQPQRSESKGTQLSADTGRGFIRDLSMAPLGLVTQHLQCDWPFSGKHGVYDFEAPASMVHLERAAAYLDVSLALPEVSRRFLLPRAEREDTLAQLQPLERRLRETLLSAYRQKRSVSNRERSKNLNLIQFRVGLREMDFECVDKFCEPLFRFLDVSNNGTVSVNEFEVLDRVVGPASLEELDELRIFIQAKGADDTSQAEQVNMQEISPLARMWTVMDRNQSGAISFFEFQRCLRKMGHPKAVGGAHGYGGQLLELYMCLDVNNSGVINEKEWTILGLLSAMFQLSRLERVREFMLDHFGSLLSAFKAMDDNRSGQLNLREWTEVMMDQHDYEGAEDIASCFALLDKDNQNVLTAKEFEYLEAFDRDSFLAEVQELHDMIIAKHGTLSEAYDAFLRIRSGSKKGTKGSKVDAEKSSAHKVKKGVAGESVVFSGLKPEDFFAGADACGFHGCHDPRFMFNFLDSTHNKRLDQSEFCLLGHLGAADEMKRNRALMHDAIAALKSFAARVAAARPPRPPPAPGAEAPLAEPTSIWVALHEELRNAAPDAA
jgi:Ca2+-binding EF-hand superfamily protein